MKIELILGSLDPMFDELLTKAVECSSVQSDPIRHMTIKGSWLDLFKPEYMFAASRELLDDTKDRFPKVQHRHLIPYIVVTHKGKIALYARTPKGTESQLHGKYSIGFGGHIDLVDVAYFGDTSSYGGVEYKANSIDLASTVEEALFRELEEELGIDEDNIVRSPVSTSGYDAYMEYQYGPREHSLIVSRASDVDSRHLALVYRVELDSIGEDDIHVEDQLNFIGWFTTEELREQYFEKLESWSQVIVAGDPLKTPSFY